MAAAPHKTIKFDYIKGNHFHVVHVDGVFGGITPRGNIHMDIWTERPPIPRHVEYEIVDGALGKEIEEAKDIRPTNIIREIEVGVTFDLEMAKATVQWLNEKIAALEAAIAKASTQASGK